MCFRMDVCTEQNVAGVSQIDHLLGQLQCENYTTRGSNNEFF